MNNISTQKERLYNLLPSIYRQRDAENGYGLRALMSVMEKEMNKVVTDIEALYDDWFAETCDRSFLPYLGELVGINDLPNEKTSAVRWRSIVANAIRHRRRKGTRSVLESAAYDATGYHTLVVEFFNRVSTTQSIHSVRLDRKSIADFRDETSIIRAGSPFDDASKLADIRSIDAREYSREGIPGRYNISSVGIFLWRLQSIERSCHAAADTAGKGRFFFDPVGIDLVLFNKADKKSDLGIPARMENMPIQLDRILIAEDLQIYKKENISTPEALRQSNTLYYGHEKAFSIFVKGELISPMRLVSANLGEWNADILNRKEIIKGNEITPYAAVDVERGRILFADTSLKYGDVSVFYHYGFSADIGGGSYDRRETLTEHSNDDFYIEASLANQLSLKRALELWKERCDKYPKDSINGVIKIIDNCMIDEDIVVSLPAGSRLAIEAADGKNPCIRRITVLEPSDRKGSAQLILNGIRIGKLLFLKSMLNLKVLHSTIIPFKSDPGAETVMTSAIEAKEISIEISHSIIGSIIVSPEAVTSLIIQDSIVDGGTCGYAIAGDEADDSFGPSSLIERTTIFGKCILRELIGSESIFAGFVSVERRQIGYVRYSYVSRDSIVPIKYMCKPSKKDSNPVMPDFVSIKYGNPGYGQLSESCSIEIVRGAKDGLEIGVFNSLHQPMREESLKRVIKDHLPANMEAGIFYVT